MVRCNGDIQRDVSLGSGADLYLSSREAADITVYGGDGGDVVLSDGGDDDLQGGSGSDDIRGGLGDDAIYGGTGADQMRGGAGADFLVFANTTDLPTSRLFDTIVDFTSGQDVIDLGAFMPGGVFIGSAEFSGAREVRFDADLGLLTGDVDGDKQIDWTLVMTGKLSLSAADFDF